MLKDDKPSKVGAQVAFVLENNESYFSLTINGEGERESSKHKYYG